MTAQIPPEPFVQYEFQFGFLNGHGEFFTARADLDTWGQEPGTQTFRMRLHHDDATEDVTINLSALAYMRTTTRTVTPEAALDADTGTLRLVGTSA